jgi:uncharacterized protein YuzE
MINPIKSHKFDEKADAIYITLSDNPVSYTKNIDETRVIDYDKKRNPVGIELLCVSDGVIISDLPYADEISRLLLDLHIKEYA